MPPTTFTVRSTAGGCLGKRKMALEETLVHTKKQVPETAKCGEIEKIF